MDVNENDPMGYHYEIKKVERERALAPFLLFALALLASWWNGEGISPSYSGFEVFVITALLAILWGLYDLKLMLLRRELVRSRSR